MLTQLISVVFSCVLFSACSSTRPTLGGLSADVTQTAQEPKFPEIPPASEFDTVPEHSDMRRLMVGPECPARCRPGPLAWIHPRSRTTSWGVARRDSGEVIARMISYGAYPKFNLQDRGPGRADTVFWAVMRIGDSVVSVFHSTKPGTRNLLARTEVYDHGPGFFRGVALARWVWSDRDDIAWGTCDGGACCRSPGGLLTQR
jgi:hypothetical protein